jgi:hypothetical protein
MSDIKIKCVHCDGKGEVDLPEPLTALLQDIRRIGPCLTTQLLDLAKAREYVTTTGMNNRLAYLERLGFISREAIHEAGKGRGSKFIWSAISMTYPTKSE